MSACFLFGCLIFFFSGKCRCETNPCAVLPHHTKSLLGKGHIRAQNQLSYARRQRYVATQGRL